MSYIGTTDFLIEVQKGNVPGHALVHKFGRNDNVPNGSWAFISLLGATAWPVSAAATVRVKLGNAADTAAGNGAREITVQGIDSNLAEITEAIATAGASASTVTTALFWRVHRAWVSSAGTYGVANTAAVTIENGTGGTDIIQIAIEEGQTQFGGWTVPTGKTAYLMSAHATVDTGKVVSFRMFTRGSINDTTAPLASKRVKLEFRGIRDSSNLLPRSPMDAIPALSDVWWECNGSAGAEQASIDFELLVVDD